jgi:hypothetical protein
VACTIGLSIYKDVKLRKKEGESSGAIRKGAFKQLVGYNVPCLSFVLSYCWTVKAS